MMNRRRQAGMTTLGWLATAITAGFLVVCLIKIGPVYMESWTVKSILEQAAEEARSEGLSKGQIRERVSKKFLVNTVNGVTMADVVVVGKGENMEIDASYEVQKPLLFNIDVVVKFDDMIVPVKES